MRRRILFVVGIAVGYIVGARAGRPAYDAVVERVKGVSGNPKVQQVAEKAKDTLEEKAPQVAAVAKQAAETTAAAASAAKEAGESADAEAGTTPEPTPPPASTGPTGTTGPAETVA